MSGYVASARIVRATPRLARSGHVADATEWAPPAESVDVQVIEAGDAADHGSILAERREAVHERWSQLTFFLFDPESWRR